jgi:nucleotide-binding universal stress UspA family protein
MTIVVGYLPNEYGEGALARGITEARLRGAKLVVVNTAKDEPLIDPKRLSDGDEMSLRRRLDEAGLDYEIRRVVDTEDPAHMLVRVADELSAELIVIGLRRRSFVGKLITGSTAQSVLVHAHCDVLAVKLH